MELEFGRQYPPTTNHLTCFPQFSQTLLVVLQAFCAFKELSSSEGVTLTRASSTFCKMSSKDMFQNSAIGRFCARSSCKDFEYSFSPSTRARAHNSALAINLSKNSVEHQMWKTIHFIQKSIKHKKFGRRYYRLHNTRPKYSPRKGKARIEACSLPSYHNRRNSLFSPHSHSSVNNIFLLTLTSTRVGNCC